jgi:hypothetical protein
MALAVWLSVSACRKPQADGPLRTRPDASTEDAGAPLATSCDQLTCTAPAQCQMNDGVATCACPSGYTGNATDCQDVDECAVASSNTCDEHSSCRNQVGSYECLCDDGYARMGMSCVQVSDCDGDANTCHIDALCTTAPEGIRCMCNSGFEGDGYVCKDIDECATGMAMCADHASCQNLRDGYDCLCDTLYKGDGHTLCQDACTLAQADAARCDPHGHGHCTYNPEAAASCTTCLAGYVGDGKTCTASDECAQLKCGSNTVCSGAPGQRKCDCAPGFSNDPQDGCVDIDECATGDATCDSANSNCLNVDGGYVCDCQSGFERVDGACVNVDECARGTALCDREATCSDSSPGYSCACNTGYEGDGYACVDIDECNAGIDTCPQDGLTRCQNTRGSYECVCPKGYTSNAEGAGGCFCDLSGYWGTREDATVVLPMRSVGDVVLIAGSTTHSYLWQLNRFRYDGQNIQIESQPCGSDIPAEVYSPQYNEVYSSSVPNMIYDTFGLQMGGAVPMSQSDALPGKAFVTPRSATLEGIKLNDPLNDPWPATSQDVPADAWVDIDHDGEPGMSLWPGQTTQPTLEGMGETYSYLPVSLQPGTTLIDTRIGCVSTGLRSIGHLEGKIETCGRLTGKVISEKTEGRVHSCTVLRKSDWDTLDVTCTSKDWQAARRCTDDQVKFLDMQDQTTQAGADFELVKLGDLNATDIDCPAVRKALPATPRQ